MKHPQGEPPPFEEGDRIELISMTNDPDPIPAGSKGTVMLTPGWFLDAWQVTVNWDSGRALALVMPPDTAVKIEPTLEPRR